ncbi:MAG: hypothetical protein RJQ09_02245 [Cyclobacteriaceae bacterium]
MRSFEEEWREAFEGAEITPTPQLWKGIEGSLAGMEVNKYRRGVFFYRMLAAASILIAFTLGLILYFQSTESTITDGSIASNENMEVTPSTSNDMEASNDRITSNDQVAGLDDDVASEEVFTSNDEVNNPTNSDGLTASVTDTKAAPIDPKGGVSGNPSLIAVVDEKDDETPIDESSGFLVLQGTEVAFDDLSDQISIASLSFRPILLDLQDFEMNRDIHPTWALVFPEKKKDNSVGQLWAGFGMSSGVFDPNVGSNNLSQEDFLSASLEEQGLDFSQNRATANAIANREESNDPGFSYAVAANLGTKIAPRWMIQSGLQYRVAQTQTSTNLLITNNVTEETFTLNDLGQKPDFELEQISAMEQSVKLNNKFEFISVPLKVGYLVLDKKLQIGLNSGITTEFFLKNKVTESNGLIDTFDQDSGGSSPYRKVFFNAIGSIDFGYKVFDYYYLSVEPSYRHAISSFTKNSLSVKSSPSSFGLTVGFRYMF